PLPTPMKVLSCDLTCTRLRSWSATALKQSVPVAGPLNTFFYNDTASTKIYTLSLHDALPISPHLRAGRADCRRPPARPALDSGRSEEHTSELQSLTNLVCRLLLEKKTRHGTCCSGPVR